MKSLGSHKRFPAAAALLLAVCAVFSSCAGNAYAGFGKTGFAMGSAVTATVFTGTEEDANAVIEDVFTGIGRLDALISATDESSEIALLNKNGSGVLSDKTLEILKDSIDICSVSDGKLDMALGAVTSLWGFNADSPSKPDKGELAAALKTAGNENIVINGNEAVLLNGAEIDLGATGKGAGCDEAEKALEKYGCPAVVSLGGTVLVYKERPGKEGWSVGVRDPGKSASDYCAVLTLDPGDGALFVSTSGSYEKSFTENGVSYHHILDPATGMPAETDLVSVTAVSGRGLISDALSTALFSLGLNEASLSAADEYLEGAVFIFGDGGIYVTKGFRDVFSLTNADDYYLLTDEEVF